MHVEAQMPNGLRESGQVRGRRPLPQERTLPLDAARFGLTTMSRPTRYPNTQTAEERALWQRIRRDLAKATAEKRKRHGLRSNKEAHLFCAPRLTSGT